MKKIAYICVSLCIIAIALLAWNCTDSELIRKKTMVQIENFSLQEAKEFYEKQIAQPVNTRARNENKKCISPGDFLPEWAKAKASSINNLGCYDIPIKSNYNYKAIYSVYKYGKASAHIVNAYQKLIVVKNMSTNKLGQYILTLIPDKEYDAEYKYQVSERFTNCADKGGFSGVAIYTIPKLELIIRVNRYVNGVKESGVYLSGNRKEMNTKISIAQSILHNIRLKKQLHISTRSFGEDDWTIDWEEENDDRTVIDLGNDDYLFTDEKGDSFTAHDSDGDGIPDTVVITPDSGDGFGPDLYPDPDPFPDYETPDEGCPICGAIGCSGECLSGGGDTSEPETPETPEEETSNTPCTDYEGNKSNPMLNMELAPPSQSNPKGATFGKTRNNGKKMHSGIDLAGQVGDPVYSAHSGTISRIVSNHVNRVNGKYPADYTGDKNAAGNRIYITVSKGVEDAYFHLQAGEPVAINPRTGRLFEVGDSVEMGEIIGYVGITGNANPNVPHLHFGVRVNNTWKNPIDYINATIHNEGVSWTISTPCDE